MKVKTKRIVIIAVAVVLLISCLIIAFSCANSGTGEPLLTLDKSKISVNLFMLMLSRMKGNLASSYGYGAQALQNSFWDSVMDTSTGVTYDKHYTAEVLESAKTYIAALALFDELNLKLPKSYEEEIDTELEELIFNDANGSKTEFNNLLAQYGANYKVLREAYILEAKIAYLSDYLFGVDGSKIASELVEDYYQSTYMRFRQVFYYTVKPKYQKDSNGDVIYYTNNEYKYISYDKKNGATKEENGKIVVDKNGQAVYFLSDGHIAYRPTEFPGVIRDANGKVVSEKLSESELKKLQDESTLLMESVDKGNFTLFDTYVEKYGEDEGMTMYPGGYYVTAKSNYDSPEVLEALADMEVGEVRKVYSEYGIHVVMKYELPKGGYNDKANADFFATKEGQLVFLTDLKSMLLADYLEQYKANIVVDEKLLATVSMKTVGANFYY